ncbi:hypothetical protein AB5N19_06242 [Seiridium cardinale]
MLGRSETRARVPPDTVVPLHFFDDTPLWRAFVLYSMFVFDDVLDPEKLRRSLAALTQRDGWRKLGARLRKNSRGGLEYHIPAEFTEDRPAISYEHIGFDITAGEHPIASRLPKPSSRPATVGSPDEFMSLFRREGGPTKVDDFLTADLPQLGLKVVSFKDKTLVCLDWPHTMMDAMGKQALLAAWILQLEGRGDEIMVNSGGAINDKDPFRELGTNPTESYKLADRRLSTFDLACYGLRNMVNFCRTPANRVVCIPASFVAELHKTALADVAGSVKAEAFLSEGDVITAWWTRIVTSQLDRKSHRTVAINNAYSLRKVLAADLLPNGTTYSSNAIGFIIVLLPIHDVLDRPLGHVALDIRAAIQDLGTRSQTEAFMSLWRTARGRLPPLFGDTGMYMLTFSNWNRARLFQTDFSAAVVAGPDNELSTESRQTVGRPTYLQNTQSGLKMRNAIPITGKDNHGNYWLSGYMNKELWGKVEKALTKL